MNSEIRNYCRIRGCMRTRKPSEIMCVTHWWQVPEPMRRRIWTLYRTQRGTIEHLRAIQEAISHVNALEENAGHEP